MKNILIVVGTRPNFIKVTQFKKLAEQYPDVLVRLVHTGQHYDDKMADVFFEQLKLVPDYFLNIAQASPLQQMAEIMSRLEKLINDEFRPDLMIVPGDVNTTFAAALVANKMNIRLAHLEAGLRSYDRSMPEEFNRILTDIVSDLFFVTEQSGMDNLRKEGVPNEKIHFVGNTMIDTMVTFRDEIEASPVLQQLDLKEKEYILMTIHRPSNVDTKEGLDNLVKIIDQLSGRYKIVFPIHPRTSHNLKKYGLLEKLEKNRRLILSGPMDYFSFQKLIRYCRLVLTDSGGVQEETTYLGVPCLTIRENTERPVTVIMGTNELVSFDAGIIMNKIREIEAGTYKKGSVPPYWDGKATERIFEVLAASYLK